MLRYIELKTGFNDDGPAWIGRVQMSRSGRTVYFNGKAFNRSGPGGCGSHYDLETGDEYWISGVKRDGSDRHRAGSGRITIEADAVDEYLRLIGASGLDRSRFIVSNEVKPNDPSRFHEMENRTLEDSRWPLPSVAVNDQPPGHTGRTTGPGTDPSGPV